MVEVTNISKRFLAERGNVRALRGVSFSVPEGSLVTLLGASGCGKSTTLRCIAGLEVPDTGTIGIDSRVVFSIEPWRVVPTEQRPIGMVFQSYAIWPHMTVFENVAYPLRGRKYARSAIAQEANRVLSLVGLAELADRPAPQLSGGQQQRVALARALIANPKVLLLDEPLSNLDAKLRQQMRIEIRKLQKNTGVTAIYVTHDQEEAMAVSDQILFMSNGQIVEAGAPSEIYARPQKKLTAEFFGEANFLPGVVKDRQNDSTTVETHAGIIVCQTSKSEAIGTEVSVFFRPEDLEIVREKPKCTTVLQGVITDTVFLGKTIECVIDLGNGSQIKASAHHRHNFCRGETVYMAVDSCGCSILQD